MGSLSFMGEMSKGSGFVRGDGDFVDAPSADPSFPSSLVTSSTNSVRIVPLSSATTAQSCSLDSDIPQVRDFLTITPSLGQNFSEDFVNLRNAEGTLLQVRYNRQCLLHGRAHRQMILPISFGLATF